MTCGSCRRTSPAPIVAPSPSQLRQQPEYNEEQAEIQRQPQEHDSDPYDPYSYSSWNVNDLNSVAPIQNPYNDTGHAFDYDSTVPYTSTTYNYPRQPLSYHLYTAPAPSTFAPTHFVADNLREELSARSEAAFGGLRSNTGLPEELQGYHTLVPLETVGGERRKFGSWYSTVYRATSAKDGGAYVLRRLESAYIFPFLSILYCNSWVVVTLRRLQIDAPGCFWCN